jgi:predicted nucleotidyltransferase
MTFNTDLKAQIPRKQIEKICRRYHIQHLSIFGSVLHGNDTPTSDVDILVEFEEGHVPGFAFAAIQRELSETLGRTVDLHTPPSLSQYFRSEVIKEAETLYDATRS